MILARRIPGRDVIAGILLTGCALYHIRAVASTTLLDDRSAGAICRGD